MRIIGKSLKGRAYKLQVDNLDDLWYLYNLIAPHDIVSSKTYRRLEKADDKIRPDKVPKKPIWLALEVEEVEFHEFSNRLRVHGLIVRGPDDLGLKSYHTLNFTPGSIIEIEKPTTWRKHQLEQLDTAVKATKQPIVTMLAMENDNAVLAQLYQYGVRHIATIERVGTGKFYTGTTSRTTQSTKKGQSDSKKDFFNNILLQLTQVLTEDSPLVILGPGFTKDDFFKFCSDKQLLKGNKVLVEPTGQAGMVGIQEAIVRGVVKRIVEDSRVTYESELVGEVLKRISMDDAVTYGLTETGAAVGVKAVETLLVIDKLIRTKNEEVEVLLSNTESSGGKVVIVSSVHDAGKQLEALGGVAALLRYKI